MYRRWYTANVAPIALPLGIGVSGPR
ncbi:hypothetical protein AYI70_g1659, partial [Smittium culicis]